MRLLPDYNQKLPAPTCAAPVTSLAPPPSCTASLGPPYCTCTCAASQPRPQSSPTPVVQLASNCSFIQLLPLPTYAASLAPPSNCSQLLPPSSCKASLAPPSNCSFYPAPPTYIPHAYSVSCVRRSMHLTREDFTSLQST